MEDIILQAWRLIDLVIAVVLGFAIGFERKLRSKEAGIRTHTIVCFGAALMTVVSKFGFGSEADAARVAAQIVTGVGFLGAGIIVFRKHEVYGLTTAAGIWATAGVGIACGCQFYLLAAGATVLLILSQLILHTPFRIFRIKPYYIVNILFEQADGSDEKIKELFGIKRFSRLSIERQDGKLLYRAELKTEKEFSSAECNEIMANNPFICSLDQQDPMPF